MSGVTDRSFSERYAERWAGSLSDIADVADAVLESFKHAGGPPHHFDIYVKSLEDGRAHERSYPSIEAFRDGSKALDINAVHEVSIAAFTPRGSAPIDDQRISVWFSGGYGMGVYISVQAPGEYEQFFIAAEDRVSRAVEKRELPMPRIDRAVDVASAALGFGAALVLTVTDSTAWLIAGLAMVAGAAAVLVLKRAARRVFPRFELLPEGGTRTARYLLGRIRWALVGLARPAYVAFLGALFGWIMSRLFD